MMKATLRLVAQHHRPDPLTQPTDVLSPPGRGKDERARGSADAKLGWTQAFGPCVYPTFVTLQ